MNKISKNLKKFKSELENSEKNTEKSWSYLTKLIRETENRGDEILKLSKEAINYSINGNFANASKTISLGNRAIKIFNGNILSIKKTVAESISKSEIEIKKINELKIHKLDDDFSSAREEFLEANFLFTYLKTGKLLDPTNPLLRDFKIYAGALADFCGELIRRARLDIIEDRNTIKDIKKYRKVLNEIYLSLSGFAFSNSSGVRGKVENLKRYIGELENILYSNRINLK